MTKSQEKMVKRIESMMIDERTEKPEFIYSMDVKELDCGIVSVHVHYQTENCLIYDYGTVFIGKRGGASYISRATKKSTPLKPYNFMYANSLGFSMLCWKVNN